MPLVSRTRATLRSAEFGFFGVVVYTRVHTPRRWGEPFSAGVLVFSTLSSRPLRTSWLIVGMGGLDLLPALGRALGVVLCSSCSVVPVLLGSPPAQVVGHRPAPGVGRVALSLGRPLVDGPDSVAPRDSAPPPLRPSAGRWSSVSRSGHPGAQRTGAGPGHPGHRGPRYPRRTGRCKPGPQVDSGPWSPPPLRARGGNQRLPRSLPGGRRRPGLNSTPAGRPPTRGPVAPPASRRARPPRSPLRRSRAARLGPRAQGPHPQPAARAARSPGRGAGVAAGGGGPRPGRRRGPGGRAAQDAGRPGAAARSRPGRGPGGRRPRRGPDKGAVLPRRPAAPGAPA